MKKLLTLSLLSFLLFFGCNQESEITSPVENNTIQEPNWIALPMESGLNIENQFSTSGWIYRDTDSEFIIDESRPGGFRGEIKTIVKLKFHKQSVSQDLFINLTADDEFTLCTFSPSQTFLKPGNLYVKYVGIDLTGINPEEITFVYMNANGIYEEIQYGELKVDINSGTLELKDGVIPHFSRYGFVN